jgi:hypothetical protein
MIATTRQFCYEDVCTDEVFEILHSTPENYLEFFCIESVKEKLRLNFLYISPSESYLHEATSEDIETIYAHFPEYKDKVDFEQWLLSGNRTNSEILNFKCSHQFNHNIIHLVFSRKLVQYANRLSEDDLKYMGINYTLQLLFLAYSPSESVLRQIYSVLMDDKSLQMLEYNETDIHSLILIIFHEIMVLKYYTHYTQQAISEMEETIACLKSLYEKYLLNKSFKIGKYANEKNYLYWCGQSKMCNTVCMEQFVKTRQISDFRDIVVNSVRSNEYTFAEEFIKNNMDLFPKIVFCNMFCFSVAQIIVRLDAINLNFNCIMAQYVQNGATHAYNTYLSVDTNALVLKYYKKDIHHCKHLADCPICYEPYLENQKFVKCLSCSFTFHESHSDNIFTCPICRVTLKILRMEWPDFYLSLIDKNEK